jgi:tRNA(Ile2) C34 agmatinyltransferase TiaS
MKRHPKVRWTQADKDFVFANYGPMTGRQIAEKLGRTVVAVQQLIKNDNRVGREAREEGNMAKLHPQTIMRLLQHKIPKCQYCNGLRQAYTPVQTRAGTRWKCFQCFEASTQRPAVKEEAT